MLTTPKQSPLLLSKSPWLTEGLPPQLIAGGAHFQGEVVPVHDSRRGVTAELGVNSIDHLKFQ